MVDNQKASYLRFFSFFRWYAPYLELLRCFSFLVIDYVLSSRQSSDGGTV